MAGADRLPLPDGIATTLLVQGTSISRIQGRLEQTLLSDGSASQRLRGAFPAGLSAEAIDTELSVLSGHVSTATSNMGSAGQHVWDVGAALETCESEVEGLQADWDELDAWFDRALADINSDPYYAEPENQRDRAEAIESIDLQRESGRDDLKERYHSAIDTFGDAASAAATRLTALTDGIVPPSQQGSVTDIAAAMTAGTTIADHDRATHVAEEQAEDASDLLERADDESLSAEERQEAIDEFNATYGDLADDPYFSAALMDEIGEEELMQHIANLQDYQGENVENESVDASIDTYLNVLGSAFVTSTNDPVGLSDYATERLTPAAETRRDEFTAAADEYYPYDDGNGHVPGWWSIGQLINGAQFADVPVTPDRAFTESLGADMMRFYYDPDTVVGMQTNNPMNMSPTGNPYPYDSLVEFPEGLELPGGVDPEQMFRDPLYSLNYSVTGDEEAATGLYLSEVGTHEVNGEQVPVSGMEYLMHRAVNYEPAYHEAMLSPVVEGAHNVARDPYDEESTQVAQEFVDAHLRLIGGEYENYVDTTFMTTSVADVWAANIDSLMYAVDDDGVAVGEDGVYAGNGPTQADYMFSISDDVRAYLPDLMNYFAEDRPGEFVIDPNGPDAGNPPALQRIIDATVLDSHFDAQNIFDPEHYQSLSGAENALQVSTDQSSLFLNYVNESLDQQGAADDAQLEQTRGYINGAVSGASGLIAGLGTTGRFVYGMADDLVMDAFWDAVGENYDPANASNSAVNFNSALEDAVYQGAYSAEPWSVDPWDAQTNPAGVMSPEQWSEATGQPRFDTDNPADWTPNQRRAYEAYAIDPNGGMGNYTSGPVTEIGDSATEAEQLVTAHRSQADQ
ncbi:hypothetical protein CZ771_04145 [Actinomycetales bacterium JB111]|nr:hypothetical protein CZ771_04145 [Actinomycetales bacterium JB111]